MGGRRALGAVQTLTGAAGPGLRGAPGGRLGAGSAPPSTASPSPKGGCLSPSSPCGAQPRHPRFPTEPRRCSHSGTSTHTNPGGTGTPPPQHPSAPPTPSRYRPLHPRPPPGAVPSPRGLPRSPGSAPRPPLHAPSPPGSGAARWLLLRKSSNPAAFHPKIGTGMWEGVVANQGLLIKGSHPALVHAAALVLPGPCSEGCPRRGIWGKGFWGIRGCP